MEINKNYLTSIGFTRGVSKWTGKREWQWGSQTTENPVDGTKMHEPIITIDDNYVMRSSTKNAAFMKTVSNMQQVEDSMNFVSMMMS